MTAWTIPARGRAYRISDPFVNRYSYYIIYMPETTEPPSEAHRHTQPLVELSQRRWAIPLISELHRSRGAKFVTLAHRIDGSTGGIRSALSALVHQGWVARNRGFGHPLRPEYILTKQGERLAKPVSALVECLHDLDARVLGTLRWPLPSLVAIDEGAARFRDLKRVLIQPTDRAISQALKALEACSLLERSLVESRPPRSEYQVTDTGRQVAKLVRAVTRTIQNRKGPPRVWIAAAGVRRGTV